MLRPRVIPTLLLREGSLVKTVQFGRFSYIGDPTNTVRIFNELEVDELVFLDITAAVQGHGPDLGVLHGIADECFMPLAYGGGLTTLEQARSVLALGFEKLVLNTGAFENPGLVNVLADRFGSQAIVGAIDVRRRKGGAQTVRIRSGSVDTGEEPDRWAVELQRRGAGEILLTSIDREGSWSGLDLELIRRVASSVDVPVIAHGGVGSLEHIGKGIHEAGASAVAVGSLVVYQRKDMGVLVNFPTVEAIEKVLLGPGR